MTTLHSPHPGTDDKRTVPAQVRPAPVAVTPAVGWIPAVVVSPSPAVPSAAGRIWHDVLRALRGAIGRSHRRKNV